ncbi:unnamed protein product [Zymoseptoria tritici ST99CH_1A5]|uniref:Uncharacterized protein n=1 Tax=Zymoseptoria tritici ST99CH_1A5 TaxID=1276529 RepID=A0A1Y6M0M6_ZYMTR|nr:unnamed protein product [Zymoseptoria tritici ST99CH_1A5]
MPPSTQSSHDSTAATADPEDLDNASSRPKSSRDDASSPGSKSSSSSSSSSQDGLIAGEPEAAIARLRDADQSAQPSAEELKLYTEFVAKRGAASGEVSSPPSNYNEDGEGDEVAGEEALSSSSDRGDRESVVDGEVSSRGDGESLVDDQNASEDSSEAESAGSNAPDSIDEPAEDGLGYLCAIADMVSIANLKFYTSATWAHREQISRWTGLLSTAILLTILLCTILQASLPPGLPVFTRSHRSPPTPPSTPSASTTMLDTRSVPPIGPPSIPLHFGSLAGTGTANVAQHLRHLVGHHRTFLVAKRSSTSGAVLRRQSRDLLEMDEIIAGMMRWDDQRGAGAAAGREAEVEFERTRVKLLRMVGRLSLRSGGAGVGVEEEGEGDPPRWVGKGVAEGLNGFVEGYLEDISSWEGREVV